MPVFRDENGNIVEESTRKSSHSNKGASDAATRRVSGDLPRILKPSVSNLSDDINTIKVGSKELPRNNTEEKTVVFRGGSSSTQENHTGLVIGWLVVKSGPGMGHSFPLGYGNNIIGRGKNSTIRLSFGDMGISRENHCSIAYDPKGRKYYLSPGSGQNLTYLGNEPVLTPKNVEDRSEISIGETELVLVYFCDSSFDWQDGVDTK